MDAWYYALNGEQFGPVLKEELQRLLATGKVKARDYVWTEGMAEWKAARDIGGLIRSEAVIEGPPPASGVPSLAPPPGERVPNYLPWAIAVTLCCCMPGGIVSIIYAVQASSAEKAGRWEDACHAAERAKMWLIVSAIVGLVGSVLWSVFSFAFSGASPMLHHNVSGV